MEMDCPELRGEKCDSIEILELRRVKGEYISRAENKRVKIATITHYIDIRDVRGLPAGK